MAVPVDKPVALAPVRMSSGGVVNVEVPGDDTLVPPSRTQTTVTLYVVPGDKPDIAHRGVAAHAINTHALLGGLMGHSLTLNRTHCKPPEAMMSTIPLVPFTASVEPTDELQSTHTEAGAPAGSVIQEPSAPASMHGLRRQLNLQSLERTAECGVGMDKD